MRNARIDRNVRRSEPALYRHRRKFITNVPKPISRRELIG